MKGGPVPNSGGLGYKSEDYGRKGPHQGGLMDPGNPMGGNKMFDESSDSDSESSNSSVGSNNDFGSNSLNKQSFPQAPNLGGMNE